MTPEGQKAQPKTLKVAEESNLMKVLKANYKIEEKNGHDHLSIDGHSQDEAKGLYWMYKTTAKWFQKVLLKPPSGDKIEFYQEVYNKKSWQSGFFLQSLGTYLKLLFKLENI